MNVLINNNIAARIQYLVLKHEVDLLTEVIDSGLDPWKMEDALRLRRYFQGRMEQILEESA